MTKKLTRVAVVMGGRSAEREISLRSGRAVLDAMDRTRFSPIAVEIELDGTWRLDGGERLPPGTGGSRLKSSGIDVAFLALHGPGGEDGTMQGFLEVVGIPYTGSDVAASAIAMDKITTRALLTACGLDVAPALAVSAAQWRTDPDFVLDAAVALGRPLFVKAPTQGSSYGVVRVKGDLRAELGPAIEKVLEFGPRALIEKGIDGVEITVPVLGNSLDGRLQALTPVEIRPRANAYFDTSEKYSPQGAEELCPPQSLTADQVALVKEWALRAHQALGCSGMSRTDMIVRPEGPCVLEVNTIPGLTNRSLLPQSAAATGIPFPELISRILDLALVKERR